MFSAMASYGCHDAAFQINLAESAEETEDDFSAVIPRI
jgi:hypothetical protein